MSGLFFRSKISNLRNQNNLEVESITAEIVSKNKSIKVLDTLTESDNILISYAMSENINKSCYFIYLDKSKFSIKKLNFKNLYKSRKCFPNPQAGRIQPYHLDGVKGFLMSVAAERRDLPLQNAQNDDNDFGKVIFISEKDKQVFKFTKGHRNPQGLFVSDKIILSTKHGPRGGDEINSLIKGKNSGWPIASYGRSYYNKELMYKKSHELENFEEPIYSFIPSIGISEIIQVSSNFWRNYSITNLFFVSSLNGRSLFQIKFDNKFERVTFVEKIFIGQRIRYLKYIETDKELVLALERPNKIAVMRSR